MKIKNFEELAVTKGRRTALLVAEAGLQAIDTEQVIEHAVRIEGDTLVVENQRFPLASVKRLFVVGVGKCSLEAGAALERILGDRITDGIVVDVHEGALQKLRTFTGTHPLPTEQNVDATKEIITLLSGRAEDDLVLFVISGGGSTLLCQPTNFTCQEESNVISCLSKAGADIHEINTLRKHLSLARGGYLAKHAYPARSVALIFSDVPGDILEFVASGPTVKDTTTVEDAKKIIAKYEVQKRCGFSDAGLVETPKEEKYFERVTNVLAVSNRVALDAMAAKAKELGYAPRIATASLSGEARDVGTKIIEEIRKSAPKTALLYGGETTVTLRKPGKGGRNQELVLSALRSVGPGECVMSIASDGRDNTDFGGALCDIITKENAQHMGADPELYLGENRSYEFFSSVGDYLHTGDTGSNVSDLIIALHE